MTLSKKHILTAFYFGNLILIILFFVSGSVARHAGGQTNFLIESGRFFGIAGAYSALVQWLLMGRISWIENYWGRGGLSRLHHANGMSCGTLILLHPILLASGFSKAYGQGMFIWVFNFLKMPYIPAAAIGWCLFLGVILLSVSAVRRKLKYKTWYLTHLFVYAAISLAFLHQVNVGADLVSNDFFRMYWYVLYGFVLAAFAYYRFVKHVLLKPSVE